MRTIRWFVALIFFSAACMKLFGANSVESMFTSLPSLAQAVLVAAELLLAVWLLSGRFPRASVFASMVTLSVFTGAIGAEMRKDHPVPCGCMGAVYVAAHDPAAIKRDLAGGLAADAVLMALCFASFLLEPAATVPAAARSRGPLAM